MSASVNPDRSEWDVIVIGAAAAGENAAQYSTQFSGLDAVMVEEGPVGGECSYWACMPSKGLLRPVEVLDTARNLPGVKELVGTRELDVPAVLARRDEIVHNLDDSSQVDWAVGAGIDIIRGTGRLSGVRTVTVTDADGAERTISARHAVVLDTGSSAALLPVDGLVDVRAWTSRRSSASRAAAFCWRITSTVSHVRSTTVRSSSTSSNFQRRGTLLCAPMQETRRSECTTGTEAWARMPTASYAAILSSGTCSRSVCTSSTATACPVP